MSGHNNVTAQQRQRERGWEHLFDLRSEESIRTNQVRLTLAGLEYEHVPAKHRALPSRFLCWIVLTGNRVAKNFGLRQMG